MTTKGILDTLVSSLWHSDSSVFIWESLLIRLEVVVISDLNGGWVRADQIPQLTAETLTVANILKLNVAGGGGGLKNSSHSQGVTMRYLPTNCVFFGGNCVVIPQAAAAMIRCSHHWDRIRECGYKGRGGKAVSGGPKMIPILKRK